MLFGFLSGAVVMGFLIAGLFFLRFWTRTRDRLFLILGLAFAVFAVNRAVLSALDPDDEARTLVYAVRLMAFALIALAVLDKNRPRES